MFAGAFFCQAEDGIRDRTVTGVQTCALPIISLVHVQSVGSDVRGEVEVGQAVVVDVTHGYSATVVVVHVGEDVERGIVGQPVGERDAGAARRQELEQLRLAGAAAAGERQRREEGQN